MSNDSMPIPRGVDEYEAEAALDTLMRAVIAAARRNHQIAEDAVVRLNAGSVLKSHSDTDREGRVNF